MNASHNDPAAPSDLERRARVVTVAELADGAVSEPAITAGAIPADPVVIIDLDTADPGNLDAAVAQVRGGDRIYVGASSTTPDPALASLLESLDVTYAGGAASVQVGAHTVAIADLGLSLDDALAAFTTAVTDNPQASLVAAQVVRISGGLSVPDAVDVESLGYSTLQGGSEYRRWLTERRELGRPLPPPPAGEPVLIDRTDDTLRLTLNRPERRNAYGTALRDAFVEALRIPLLDDTIDRVIVDGAGSSFCAGGDLDEFGHMPDSATAHLIRTRGGAGRLVGELADRIEFRVHGHCVGAGIEIPAFASHVVAEPDSIFRYPEVGMGLIPGAGGTVSAPRRIGRWRALHLFVTGEAITAPTAVRWGLVDEIVEKV